MPLFLSESEDRLPTVTIKGMPDALHRRLKSRAQERGRSLSEEILFSLGAAVSTHRVDPETWLRRAAVARSKVKRSLTDADLEA